MIAGLQHFLFEILKHMDWKKEFDEKSTPVLPVSEWMDEDPWTKLDNMGRRKEADVAAGKETIHVDGKLTEENLRDQSTNYCHFDALLTG